MRTVVNKKALNPSVKRNAVLNIIYKISSMIFPLIVYPYVSRVLLSGGLGKVAFFTNITNYAMLIGSLGISTYGIRATAKVRDDKEKLSKVVKELFTINSIVTLLVLVFLFLSLLFVDKFRTDIALFFICCGQVAIAPLSMDWLYGGLEQYGYITRRAITFKVISLVLIFAFVHTQSDYVIYALITAFGYVGNYICNFIHSRKFVTRKVKGKLNLRIHLKPTLLLFASLLAVSIYTNVDSIMLGFINGDNAVGLYDVAVKAKTVLLSLINAISAVLLPRLSYYVAQKNEGEYKSILRKSIRVIAIIAVPLTIFFELEALDCILVLGGEHYRSATLCMMILMPILLISGFSNITGNQILIPHGMDSCFTKAVTLGAIVDIVLNALFMPKFSLYGAAMATLIAEITQMMVQAIYSKKYLRGEFDLNAGVKIVIAAFIPGICVFFLRRMLNINALINLIIYFIIFGLIYWGILYFFKFEEVRNIKSTIKEILKGKQQ